MSKGTKNVKGKHTGKADPNYEEFIDSRQTTRNPA